MFFVVSTSVLKSAVLESAVLESAVLEWAGKDAHPTRLILVTLHCALHFALVVFSLHIFAFVV
ncbi:hypothetical protein DSM106972_068940 [Dulcicalothrix desertica PCC 7102]|uniref:Uncharacterized protein n=1 Tax=Dulcicalothrix desertica PCC 7102 TaxID=232991 RepID=A0A433V5F4_9CYAN|nr:hypothetical protein DSM106972_068940 [Dulcicalothrix desertica PCC 7102]